MDRVEYQSLIVQDLINLDRAEELNIAPWYQRRSVWNDSQRSYLINTIFEKKPIPAIYVRHHLDIDRGKSIKEVVDGQQRTRAIVGYQRGEFKAFHPAKDKKVLYSELSKEQQQSFLLTSLPVGFLLGASDADVIEIFGRINSVSKSLNAQEKRNAQFSGDFKQFCLREASKRIPIWRGLKIFSGTEISRMDEVQFISDLTINFLDGLTDFSGPKIDKYYDQYDSAFPKAGVLAKRFERLFSLVVEMNPDAIAETAFRRQPLFFSLAMAIDENLKVPAKRLEDVLLEIDRRVGGYGLKDGVSEKDRQFIKACSSSTQRIAQRKVRQRYIQSFL